MTEELRFQLNTLDDAKSALATIKQKRAELVAAKKEHQAEVRRIRADYRSRVAQRGSKVRGGGTLGKIARAAQTAARDTDRANTDKAIRPHEAAVRSLDTDIRGLDELTANVKDWIEEFKATQPVPEKSATSRSAREPDPLELLERLGKLREAGVITDEEFEEKKRDLLARI